MLDARDVVCTVHCAAGSGDAGLRLVLREEWVAGAFGAASGGVNGTTTVLGVGSDAPALIHR